MAFPLSPTVGDIYSEDGRSWRWNGYAWREVAFETSSSSGFVDDHGALTGLADDDHTHYLRADGTLRASSSLTVDGDIETTSGTATVNGVVLSRATTANDLRVTATNGYIDIGPKNSSYCHVYTDMPEFYFNKPALLNGRPVTATEWFMPERLMDRTLSASGSTGVTLPSLTGTIRTGYCCRLRMPSALVGGTTIDAGCVAATVNVTVNYQTNSDGFVAIGPYTINGTVVAPLSSTNPFDHSNLNFTSGQSIGVTTVVKLDENRYFSVYVNTTSTTGKIILDVLALHYID